MRRTAAIWVVLAGLVACVAFDAFGIFFGHLHNNSPIALLLMAFFPVLASIAIWKLSSARPSGLWLALLFWGLQLVDVEFQSGEGIGFYHPTILIRLNSDKAAPVNLNIVALIFVAILISVVLRQRRIANSADHE